jgi:hypothetical protein
MALAKRVAMQRVPRVTNADLAGMLSAMDRRLTVIETEARVAKWLLRLLGAVFGSIITYAIAHWKGSK